MTQGKNCEHDSFSLETSQKAWCAKSVRGKDTIGGTSGGVGGPRTVGGWASRESGTAHRHRPGRNVTDLAITYRRRPRPCLIEGSGGASSLLVGQARSRKAVMISAFVALQLMPAPAVPYPTGYSLKDTQNGYMITYRKPGRIEFWVHSSLTSRSYWVQTGPSTE